MLFQNLIENCNIGMDADGTAVIGNYYNGIMLINSHSNTLVSNLIAGNNENGIAFYNSNDNYVVNNEIGINQSGTCFGNGNNGILIAYSSGNFIGGDDSSRNVISCNDYSGINVTIGSNNDISYNYIGTDYSGESDRGNAQSGVYVTGGADYTVISYNLISGNGQSGVYINGGGTDDTSVHHNRVGSNLMTTAAIGNGEYGVAVYDGPANSEIDDNVIVASGLSGLAIRNSNNNSVASNRIGVGYDSAITTLGNAYYGVIIQGSDNRIDYNTIAYNGLTHPTEGDGIRVDGASYSAVGNFIHEGSIYANGGMGINNVSGGNNDYTGPILDPASSCTFL